MKKTEYVSEHHSQPQSCPVCEGTYRAKNTWDATGAALEHLDTTGAAYYLFHMKQQCDPIPQTKKSQDSPHIGRIGVCVHEVSWTKHLQLYSEPFFDMKSRNRTPAS